MAKSPEQSSNSADDNLERATARATVSAAKATRISAVIAGISVVLSVFAVAVGFYSVHIARQQNLDAQQQELVTLVTDMAQGPLNIVQASEDIKDNPATLHNVDVQIQLTELGEGEEADSIIQSLPNSEVSSVEEYQVGMALENGLDNKPALELFTSAALKASDPRTESDSWRAAASILYALGDNSAAENDTALAEVSYNRPDVTTNDRENNIAYTELSDIQYQVFLDCPTAGSEWNDATQIIAGNPNVLTNALIMTEQNAATDLIEKCHVPASTLKGALALAKSEG